MEGLGRNGPFSGVASESGKGQAFHDARDIDVRDQTHFAKVPFTFPVLAFSKVPTTLFPAQDFSCTVDLETFGNAFSRLASGDVFSHRRARP